MRWMIAAAVLWVSPLEAQTTVPTWQLIEDLRIGSVDGDDALSRVSSLTINADGTKLYVAQQLEHSIRVFDARSGVPLQKIGRQGEGPGEFRHLTMIGWTADTLYATDFLLQRLSLFSETGEHFQTERVHPPLLAESRRGSYPIGLTADGNVISHSQLPSAMIADGRLTSSPWALVSRDGKVIRNLATLDLRETSGAAPAGTWTVHFRHPMSNRTYLALHPRGTSMAVVRQPAGKDSPGNYEVLRLRPDGSTIYAKNYAYTPRALSAEVSDSLYDELARDMSSWLPPARAAAAAKKYLIVPATYPPVSSVVLGRDDSVWLRKEDVGGAPVRWLVLDPQGSIRATVNAPAGLKIHYADESTVWGVVHDALDTPFVVRFRLQR